MSETEKQTNEVRLPDTSRLVVSCSPHFHSSENVSRIMLTVIIALLPACAAGIYFFGMRALMVLSVSAVACVGFEALFCHWQGQKSALGNYSALLTGILLGMNLSPLTPWWVCVIGALLAIGLGKQIYGGLGYNPFNPALVARVGLLIAFPKLMTTWAPPRGYSLAGAVLQPGAAVDAVSSATPLYAVPSALQETGTATYEYASYFLGRIGGCVGETSALALLIGAVILLSMRLIRWQVPVAFIGTVAIGAKLMELAGGQPVGPPLFHVLTGGLLLGAIFMATDMVTSPMTGLGGFIFGLGCGVITCVIRFWGSYPEGVSFSILFMNALTPLIDRFTAGRPFGAGKQQKVS